MHLTFASVKAIDAVVNVLVCTVNEKPTNVWFAQKKFQVHRWRRCWWAFVQTTNKRNFDLPTPLFDAVRRVLTTKDLYFRSRLASVSILSAFVSAWFGCYVWKKFACEKFDASIGAISGIAIVLSSSNRTLWSFYKHSILSLFHLFAELRSRFFLSLTHNCHDLLMVLCACALRSFASFIDKANQVFSELKAQSFKTISVLQSLSNWNVALNQMLSRSRLEFVLI